MDYYKNEFLLKLLKADTFEEISDILCDKKFISDTSDFLANLEIEGKKYARIILSCFILVLDPEEMIGKDYRDSVIYYWACKIRASLAAGDCNKDDMMSFINAHRKWAEGDIITFKKDIEKTYRDLLEAYEKSSYEGKEELSKELKSLEQTYFNLTGDIFKNDVNEKKDESEYYKEIRDCLVLLYPHSAEELEREINVELYHALDDKGKEVYGKKLLDNIYYYSSKFMGKKLENIEKIMVELIEETKRYRRDMERLNKAFNQK